MIFFSGFNVFLIVCLTVFLSYSPVVNLLDNACKRLSFYSIFFVTQFTSLPSLNRDYYLYRLFFKYFVVTW